MKNVMSFIVSAVAFALMSFTGNQNEGTYKIDTKASTLQWTGYHLAKSYEHTGNVTIKSGNLVTDDEKITGGEFVIDMNTITDEDLKDAKDNAKLVNHLKSEDFFAINQFPEAKLVIKGSEKKGDNVYKTTADLTIRGITKTITFDTKVTKLTDNEITASADIIINRTDFKVMYGWKVENAMLSGEFKMQVNLTANK
ncbi:MAG: YceI family protein [Chitinophagales bacterium]|nr:YceI family protein [Chitinophagales bacterium]